MVWNIGVYKDFASKVTRNVSSVMFSTPMILLMKCYCLALPMYPSTPIVAVVPPLSSLVITISSCL